MQAVEFFAGDQTFSWHRDQARKRKRPRQGWQTVLRKAFLPEGYPDSVTSDYARMGKLTLRIDVIMRFILADCLQIFSCGTLYKLYVRTCAASCPVKPC